MASQNEPQENDLLALVEAVLRGSELPAQKREAMASVPTNVTINLPQIIFRITYKEGWFHVYVGLVMNTDTIEDLSLKSVRQSLEVADTIAKGLSLIVRLNRDNLMGYQTHLFTTSEVRTWGTNIPQELREIYLEQM
jgi:hypothetical protein